MKTSNFYSYLPKRFDTDNNNLINVRKYVYAFKDGERFATDHEKVQGVDPTKTMALKAVFEVARWLECEKAKVVDNYDNAEKVWRYFRPILGTADHEETQVLMMNNRFKLIKAVKLSSGGLSETAVDVRIILREALLCNATVITLVHNHPSGQLKPSMDDKRLTMKVKQACETMRIFLVDHVIVTNDSFYSFNDEGQL